MSLARSSLTTATTTELASSRFKRSGELQKMPDTDPWTARTQRTDQTEALAQALQVPEPLARLLVCRGLETPAAALAFLHPSLDQLHDPYGILGMNVAVERLLEALRCGEPVLIYGDYDVDGTIATVLLKTALDRSAACLGVTPDVRYHIPHRLREGYGMRESRLEDAAAAGIRLVVSVDTGIRAFAAAEEAARLGLDLIVTDHHLPDGHQGVPRAVAVLNPNQPGCPYPCKDLCGAAVSFKLAQALLERSARDAGELDRVRRKTIPSFLKLLAIATVADAVPLTGENRVIAALGLAELRKPAQVGLRALMDLAGIGTERAISAIDVGFRLAPRINAAGRMDVGSDVVDMFLTRDPETARTLAAKLHRLNDDRRATEAVALKEIEDRLVTLAALPEGLPDCLVLDDADGSPQASQEPEAISSQTGPPASATPSPRVGEGWHRGVVGILASRVVDRTGRPALVLAHEGGEAHGSGRSVAGFHLLDALTAVHAESQVETGESLFSRFGGHAHAVGFALGSHRVPQLRERLARYAAAQAFDRELAEAMLCDLEVTLPELDASMLGALQGLQPFGNGNAEPLLLCRGVRLVSPPRAIKEKHLRLAVEDARTGTRFSGVAWSRRTCWAELAASEAWQGGDYLDLAFRLRRNEHPEFGGSWELDIVAARRSLARPGLAQTTQAV